MDQQSFKIGLGLVVTSAAFASWLPIGSLSAREQTSSAKGLCTEFSSHGRLSAHSDWHVSVQHGLELRFSWVSGGWWMDVGPGMDLTKDFAWPVNPPFRSPEQLVIGPAYYTDAKKSAASTPRVFRFVLNERDFGLAVQLASTDMDFRIRDRRINELGRSVITLNITDFQVQNDPDGRPIDSLAWIVFSGSSCVPAG